MHANGLRSFWVEAIVVESGKRRDYCSRNTCGAFMKFVAQCSPQK